MVNGEWAPLCGLRERWIRPHNLQVHARTQAEESVSGAQTGMLPSRRCCDAEQTSQFPKRSRQVRGGVNEMVDRAFLHSPSLPENGPQL